MKKILILSPLSDQALAVARYIHRYDRFCVLHGGFLPGELLRTASFYKKVLYVNNANILENYDIVLPTGAQSTHWMATQFEEFKVNNLSYTKNNLQYFDKIRVLKRVKDLGIPIPETYETVDAIDAACPLFYKQKYESGGGARGIAQSQDDLKKLANKHELLFQEYIPGPTTYGFGFLVKDNIIVTSFQHAEILSQPVQGGSAVAIRRYYDDRLKTYTQRIVQNLGFEGWGLAEYKYCTKRRDFVFMEINAKLWASIEFAFMNNNNFLKYMFDLEYPEVETNSALFIDRLVKLGLKQILRNSPYFFSSKIIRYNSPSMLLRSLITGAVPSRIRQYLKRMF